MKQLHKQNITMKNLLTALALTLAGTTSTHTIAAEPITLKDFSKLCAEKKGNTIHMSGTSSKVLSSPVVRVEAEMETMVVDLEASADKKAATSFNVTLPINGDFSLINLGDVMVLDLTAKDKACYAFGMEVVNRELASGK